MQEIFSWTFKTSISMKDELQKLVRNGYKIQALSHCERTVCGVTELSCFVVVTKTIEVSK